MNIPIQTVPSCPYCHTFDVVPYTARPFILAGAGGLLGGALMIALTISGKTKSRSVIVNSVVFGVLSGASIGMSMHKGGTSPKNGRRYLCCRCFHSFAYIDSSVS